MYEHATYVLEGRKTTTIDLALRPAAPDKPSHFFKLILRKQTRKKKQLGEKKIKGPANRHKKNN